MTNAEIAAAFDELAVLYELDGAVKYRVLAYSTAAKAIRESPVSVAELAREGRATALPGVGETLEGKIQTLLETGDIPSAERLRAKFPASLIAVTRVPGLGAKTARRLYDELGVSSLEELKTAAEAQRIRGIRGLGPKAEENILAALERLGDPDQGPGRLLLSKVRPVATELAEALREHPAANRVEVAGSVRRWAETCKDIDLIATSEEPRVLAEALAVHPLLSTAGDPGENGVRGQTHNGVTVELRIVAPEKFGNLLQHFTGSQAHNIRLREDAVSRGLSVSEHGVTDSESGEVTLCAAEEEVYERLGYEWIEPELREGRGELRAARDGSLPQLVEIGDVRGDLHSHTTLSDGRNTLAQMADAAQERGYQYLALTDHSATHGFGNHVTDEMLWERVEEVRRWNKGRHGFRLLAGSEVNIGLDGELDYPEDLLAELDWVVASLHTAFSGDESVMTGRILTAIENPYVDCIGHLTGRLLLRREPYPVDVESVADAAARTGTMLEINGNPNRRDLSEHHARLAAEAGVSIVLNTDAHGTETMANMAYAVATARRAWLGPDAIANTRGWREFAKLRKRAR
ncbi:MAG TPA: DNA polymerase/3'-5' exonuclease PolX [Solirubrobacterales bacterium]|nr:DNA polymerase/3'-5' exonuclease PolX [Solirubrobacterales bacterium]